MKSNQVVSRFLPAQARNKIRVWREARRLNAEPRLTCTTERLIPRGNISLAEMFASPDLQRSWNTMETAIQQFRLPNSTGGVNLGDRRAIFYLVNALQPSAVLEIGTHIGASTVHIAAALHQVQLGSGRKGHLSTVDVVDVNSPVDKHWEKYGASSAPTEMIDGLGFRSMVEFHVDSSLRFLSSCERKFDFIFLDGDHSARTVYQEIPAALDLLQQGGVILLHDFFPDLRPLWSNGSVIPGPFLATERLRQEGANLVVCPLGKLPWPTKLGSRVTSLALLAKSA